jgi:hypothetical protein
VAADSHADSACDVSVYLYEDCDNTTSSGTRESRSSWTGLVASEREAERDQSPDSTESRSERRGERWDRWGNNAESIASSHILKFHSRELAAHSIP